MIEIIYNTNIKLNSIPNNSLYKKWWLLGAFSIICLMYGCYNNVDEEPFQAKVVAVYPIVDGSGYSLVLVSVDNPNIWASAITQKKFNEFDTVIVDKGRGSLFYNGKMEGKIIKHK